MTLLTRADFTGIAAELFRAPDRDAGLEKGRVFALDLGFDGIAGDCHKGETRLSDSRTLKQYPRNTLIRNVRQVTLVSAEELETIATAMGIAAIAPEWLGANVLTRDIPNLTLLPPSTRIQFPSGATLVVDMENAPCRQVADVILKHHPDQAMGFVKAATHKRGVTAWVERPGQIDAGDEMVIWLPPQRFYAATAG